MMYKNLSIIQINLQNSRAATYELIGQMLHNNLNLAFVQEPYAYKNQNIYHTPKIPGLQFFGQYNEKIIQGIYATTKMAAKS